MFISKKTAQLMQENAVLCAKAEMLRTALNEHKQREEERRSQEEKSARQFDNLFSYNGEVQSGGKM